MTPLRCRRPRRPRARPASTVLLLYVAPRSVLSVISNQNLDAIPTTDTHKVRAVCVQCSSCTTVQIGVLYAGRGQTTEAEVLRNEHGSLRYMEFLDALGEVGICMHCTLRLRLADDCAQGLQ